MQKKIILIIILFTLSVVTAVSVYTKKKLDVVLKEKLTEAFDNAFQGEYTIQALSCNTNLVTGSADFSGVQLSSKNHEKSGNLKVYIGGLSFTGLSFGKYFFNKEVEFHQVKISNTNVYYNDIKKTRYGTETPLPESLSSFLSGLSKNVKVKEFRVVNSSVNYLSRQNNHKIATSAKISSLKWNNIFVKSKEKPYITSGGLSFIIKDAAYSSPTSNIKFKTAEGNSQKKTVFLENIESTGIVVNSGLNFTGSINRLDVKNFSFPQNLKDYSFNASNVVISNADIEATKTGEIVSKDTTLLGPSSFKINDFQVLSSTITFNNYSKTKDVRYSTNLNVNISNLNKDREKSLRFDNVSLAATNFSILTPNDKLTATHISTSTKTSSLNIKNLKYYQSESKSQTGVDLNIKGLNLSKFNVKKLAVNQLEGGVLSLTNPNVKFSVQSSETDTDKSLNEIISKFTTDYVEQAQVKKVSVLDGKLIVNQKFGKEKLNQKFSKINLLAKDVSVANGGKNYPLQDRKTSVSVGNYYVTSTKGNFNISADNIKIGSKKTKGENVQISQLVSRQSTQPYYFKSNIESFSASNLNLYSLLNKNEVHLDSLVANDLKLYLELDERREPGSDQTPPLKPRDILLLIPFPVDVKKLKVNKSKVKYNHIAKGRYKPATLTFDSLNLSLTDLNNKGKDEDISVLKGTCKVQHKANFSFSIKAPLMSPIFKARYSGKMEEIKASEFNNWFAFADIGLRKGTISQASFDFAIVDQKANGIFSMPYHDFRVNVYNAKTGKKSKIKSFLSRAFIHKNNKPGKNGKKPAIRVNSELSKEDSFLYWLWHPVKKGMVETVTKNFYTPED